MLYQFQLNHINLDANRSPVLSYPLKIVMESNCRFLVDIVSGGKIFVHRGLYCISV